MSSTERQRLELRVREVGGLIAQREHKLATDSHDAGSALTLASLRVHLDDLSRQLTLLRHEESPVIAERRDDPVEDAGS